MRGQSTLIRNWRPRRLPRPRPESSFVCLQCRSFRIAAAPATESPSVGGDATGASRRVPIARDSADAWFEVLGSPHSLLSVTLSASQKLYTRRGTLVSVTGHAENAQSTLSILSPFRRALLGMPFLYQRMSSTTPITALIATKSPNTTFTVLHLDGTTDWIIGQRNALLAWTGHTLKPTPRIRRGLSLAHWGATHLTGRGLAALASPGTIYEVTLSEGDELVVHPSHVAAYTHDPKSPPLPFRLKSTRSLRLQVPAVPASISNLASRAVPERLSNFMSVMRTTDTYKFVARLLYGLRTATRRTLWGDRLFLRFRGPTTLLMSSRGVRVAEALSSDDVNEIADTEAGVVHSALTRTPTPPEQQQPIAVRQVKPVSIHVASVGGDGKVRFEDSKDLREFVR